MRHATGGCAVRGLGVAEDPVIYGFQLTGVSHRNDRNVAKVIIPQTWNLCFARLREELALALTHRMMQLAKKA
eukprot:9167213-Karenia_brevis.AAC.1